MFVQYILIGPLGNCHSAIMIFEAPDCIISIGQIFFNADVMLIRLEYAVIIALD